jgi:hypothetical protein
MAATVALRNRPMPRLAAESAVPGTVMAQRSPMGSTVAVGGAVKMHVRSSMCSPVVVVNDGSFEDVAHASALGGT